MTITFCCELKLDVRGFKTRSKMLTSLWFAARVQKESTPSGCCMSVFLPVSPVCFGLVILNPAGTRSKRHSTKVEDGVTPCPPSACAWRSGDEFRSQGCFCLSQETITGQNMKNSSRSGDPRARHG